MYKLFLLLCSVVFFLGCTNLDDKHVFRFEIDGSAASVDNMLVKMGPGINFDSKGEVYLPVSITHDIYGEDLIYFFEIQNSDPTEDINLKVFIDDQLIQQNDTFDLTSSVPKITISGIY